jgi:hypothetical protein
MADFSFKANLKEIADKLGQTTQAVSARIKSEVGKLSISTHAFVVAFANERLTGFNRDHFFGKNNKNVRWTQVADGYWVVEIDESVRWIEEGRCVVYSKNSSHIPTVLTPDGEIKITDIKIGSLVLNQHGKWTAVKEIIDQHLVEESVYDWTRIESCSFDENTKKSKRISLNYVEGTCRVCGHITTVKKWHSKTMNNQRCQECFSKKDLVSIAMITRPLNGKNLVVTGNHPVLTQSGWKEARDLDDKVDLLMTPSWSECVNCGDPAAYGEKFCHGYCGSSFAQKELVKAGKHHSQSPNFLSSIYMKVLARCARGISNAEEECSKKILSLGYSMGFHKEGTFDCIRQYPIVANEPGAKCGKRYYYIDFFFPKLNLAIEIDGKGFHTPEGDTKRDNALKQHGIDTIRIDSRKVFKKDFTEMTLKGILSNHSDNISFLPQKIKVEKFYPGPFYGLRRRWDISVEEGASFVCQGVVIHNSPTFMGDWLLKPGAPGVKTAKDGSQFRVIPMNQTKNSKKDPVLFHNIKYALQQNNIDMKKLTKGPDNKPILGVVAKLGIKEKRTSYPEMHFSEPRNRQTANKLGLPETHGHHYLDNAVVTQRKVGGKVKKEVVTFRVISSKHKQEGRWFYPKVEALNSIPEAYKYANEEWGKIVNSLQQEFTKGLE